MNFNSDDNYPSLTSISHTLTPMSISQQGVSPVTAFNSFIHVYRIVLGFCFLVAALLVFLLLLILHKKQPVKSRFIAPYFGLLFIIFRYGYR